MASLLDIAPLSASVNVRGTLVAVTGVSAKGIAGLLQRFPELRAMMVGRTVAPDRLMEMGGDAVAAIIAAGTGFPSNPEAEAFAGTLLIEEQADLLSAIIAVTLPRGVGPLVEKLSGMAASLGDGVAA
ncbi:MAG: hypothetical protein V4747_11475 [Pseudomonadota bacterium]